MESTDRRNMRTQFQALFDTLRDPQSNSYILELFASMIVSPELQEEWLNGGDSNKAKGCSQEFIDSLPRVPRSEIPLKESCPICYEKFGDDEYPLVAELPHCHHYFDVQCISLWLSKHATCPLCRDVVNQKTFDNIDLSKAELEEDWGMYS